jgi:hypothetical protein
MPSVAGLRPPGGDVRAQRTPEGEFLSLVLEETASVETWPTSSR